MPVTAVLPSADFSSWLQQPWQGSTHRHASFSSARPGKVHLTNIVMSPFLCSTLPLLLSVSQLCNLEGDKYTYTADLLELESNVPSQVAYTHGLHCNVYFLKLEAWCMGLASHPDKTFVAFLHWMRISHWVPPSFQSTLYQRNAHSTHEHSEVIHDISGEEKLEHVSRRSDHLCQACSSDFRLAPVGKEALAKCLELECTCISSREDRCLLQPLWILCALFDIHLVEKHLSGSNNVPADALSQEKNSLTFLFQPTGLCHPIGYSPSNPRPNPHTIAPTHLSSFHRAVDEYLHLRIAPSTCSAYSKACLRYIGFCHLFGLQPIPSSGGKPLPLCKLSFQRESQTPLHQVIFVRSSHCTNPTRSWLSPIQLNAQARICFYWHKALPGKGTKAEVSQKPCLSIPLHILEKLNTGVDWLKQ